jgi:hypothetical protein
MLLDLPGEVEKQAVLLLAALQELAVGLGLLTQFEQGVVQDFKEGGGCRRGWGCLRAGHGRRRLGSGGR